MFRPLPPLLLAAILPLPAVAADPAPAAGQPAAPAAEQAPAPGMLADSRWYDGVWGVILTEPAGMARQDHPAPEVQAMWTDPANGYRISAQFLTLDREEFGAKRTGTSLEKVMLGVSSILKGSTGTYVDLKSEGGRRFTGYLMSADRKPGMVSHFLHKPGVKADEDRWLIGFAVMQINHSCHLLLRMEARVPAGASGELPYLDEASAKLEAMARALRCLDAKVLMETRQAQLERGARVLSGLQGPALAPHLVADQLFRVVAGGKDVGYARLWQRRQDAAWYKDHKPDSSGVDALREPGLMVVLQSHAEADDQKLDSRQAMFTADNLQSEAFERLATLRFPDPLTRKEKQVSSKESGLLDAPTARVRVAPPPADLRPGRAPEPEPAPPANLRIHALGSTPPGMADYFLSNPDWRRAADRVWQRTAQVGAQRGDDRLAGVQPTAPAPANNLQARLGVSVGRDPGTGFAGEEQSLTFPVAVADARMPWLSQGMLMLMPRLLPMQAQSYAFFTYSGNHRRPGMCLFTVQVPEDDQGRPTGKRVGFKAALDQPEQAFVFDAANRLLAIELPDGSKLLPASAAEVQAIWQDKGKP